MNLMMTGTYNYWLVALSFGIAMITSYVAISLVERVTASYGNVQRAWLTGGAVALGSGIWCMHYMGMLAFHLPILVCYHLPTVGLSLLAAILASLVALFVASRRQMGWVAVLCGSVLMGGGIATMHYVGMAAMRLRAAPVYHMKIVAVSIVIAISISYVGLTLLFYTRKNRGVLRKVMVALIVGLSIPVMHYTGMAAVDFQMSARPINYAHAVDISALADSAISGLTVLILGFAMMISVVDRRMSAQNRVLDRERKMLRALIDHIPDLMYIKDREGRFLLANRGLAKLVGVTDPQFLIGRTDFDFFPYALAAKFREDELKVMRSGTAITEEEGAGMTSNGDSVPILTTKVALRDAEGEIVGIAGVGRNITDLKRSEAALLSAEQKYKKVFDEALVGIFSIGADGSLIQVNPAMASFMGYESPEEMYALLTDGLFAAAASSKGHDEILKMVMTDGYVKSFELEVYRKNGEKIWISSSMQAKYDGSTLVGFSGMFADVTERRILREQLLQAQKLESVGQLAAGIAHEINTPVQYIGDNVRFLGTTFDELVNLHYTYGRLLEATRNHTLSPEILGEVELAIERADVNFVLAEIPKAIAETLEGVSRVAGLVNAMKDFSHPGTREKVALDLNRAIESTVTVTRNEWKYVAEMDLNLDGSLPMVLCLPGEFNQVILNLIVNAAHAITDVAAVRETGKGLISIGTRGLGDKVEIRIQDTGGGIPEDIRTRIFDPFFTTKEIGKGTGQGLAIARSIVVDKHQGSIEVDSDGKSFTTFIIRLPCEAAQATIVSKAAA